MAVPPACGLCSQVAACGLSLTWSQMRKTAPRLEESSFFQKADLITLKSKQTNNNNNKKRSTVLVYELVCVSVHPVLRGEGHFIEVAAVVAAFTGLYKHGGPLEALAVRAHKGHGNGARAAWRAAPAVRAHTAVVGPVEADTHTLSVRQVDGFWGFLGWGAGLSFLGRDGQAVARPYGADPRFPLQLALRVLVGDTRGNAHPTGPGALGPVGGLEGTLLLQAVPHGQVFVAVFTLPAAMLDVCKLVGEHQLIFSVVRCRMVLRSGQVVLWWRNRVLRWKVPGALMAVDTEAALPGYPDQPWVGAGWGRWWKLVATEGSAANSAINAGTLVFAAGTEALAVLVDPAVVLTCASL